MILRFGDFYAGKAVYDNKVVTVVGTLKREGHLASTELLRCAGCKRTLDDVGVYYPDLWLCGKCYDRAVAYHN